MLFFSLLVLFRANIEPLFIVRASRELGMTLLCVRRSPTGPATEGRSAVASIEAMSKPETPRSAVPEAFDGIFLTGILAVLLASLYARPRAARAG